MLCCGGCVGDGVYVVAFFALVVDSVVLCVLVSGAWLVQVDEGDDGVAVGAGSACFAGDPACFVS